MLPISAVTYVSRFCAVSGSISMLWAADHRMLPFAESPCSVLLLSYAPCGGQSVGCSNHSHSRATHSCDSDIGQAAARLEAVDRVPHTAVPPISDRQQRDFKWLIDSSFLLDTNFVTGRELDLIG